MQTSEGPKYAEVLQPARWHGIQSINTDERQGLGLKSQKREEERHWQDACRALNTIMRWVRARRAIYRTRV